MAYIRVTSTNKKCNRPSIGVSFMLRPL